jgi:predicted metal-dependent enzyme (double-stranded beta helix superfamily)
MQEVDQRITLASDYLAEARQRSVEQLAPTLLMRECAELRRLLGQVLDVLAERQDGTRQLAEVRAILAGFDWEFSDRQLALEAIERIITEGAS